MRKLILSLVLFIALAAGGYGGYEWWTVGRFVVSTDNAYLHSDVSVVSPQVAGYVAEVQVADNQKVAAGDVLATIQDREFKARVAEAAAAVQAAKAGIASADSQLVLQRSMIEQAQAGVVSAQAESRRVQQDLQRYRGLVKENFVSKQRFETVEADVSKTGAAVNRADAELAAARKRIGVLEATRTEGEAKLAQAEASLAQAQIDLDRTIIRAPVDGVIGNKGVQVGQYVRAGTQMMSVVPLPDVYVVANFKETQLEGLRPGQKAELKVDAFPDGKLVGTVESFSPASGSQFSLLPPENATGNFTKVVQRVPVRIAVPRDNPLSGLLRPGLSVVVSIDTRGKGEAHYAGGIFGVAAAAELQK